MTNSLCPKCADNRKSERVVNSRLCSICYDEVINGQRAYLAGFEKAKEMSANCLLFGVRETLGEIRDRIKSLQPNLEGQK